MPSIKEPHFFDQRNDESPTVSRRPQAWASIETEAEYLDLFRQATANQLLGEASATYLGHASAAHRIKQRNAQAKIIAVLRKPIDRAYSAFLFETRSGREAKTSFYEALVDDHDNLQKFSNGLYIWPGFYYQQVKRYLNTFGAAQVRIFLYEDLAADTFSVVSDICSFLGVDFLEGSFFDPTKKYHYYGAPSNLLFKWVRESRLTFSLAKFLVTRSVLSYRTLIPLRDRLVSSERPKPPLDPEASQYLRSVYHDDILKLQNLIGRDLSAWLA